MKIYLQILLVLSLLGCSNESKPVAESSVAAPAQTRDKAAVSPSKEGKDASEEALKSIMRKKSHDVMINDVQQSGEYTYVQVIEEGLMYWVAGPKTALKAGGKLELFSQMWMKSFKSKTMNRSFDVIMFVESFTHSSQAHKEESIKLPSIALLPPVKGGMTIKETYANAAALNGKTVSIHGTIVKTNFEIMKKNWVHVIDGSSQTDDGIITATTMDKNIKEGDEIILTGKLRVDKDFGFGYFYKVLLEDGTVKAYQ